MILLPGPLDALTHLTVVQNIAFGLPRRKRRDAATLSALVESVSLDDALRNRCRTNSPAGNSNESPSGKPWAVRD